MQRTMHNLERDENSYSETIADKKVFLSSATVLQLFLITLRIHSCSSENKRFFNSDLCLGANFVFDC